MAGPISCPGCGTAIALVYPDGIVETLAEPLYRDGECLDRTGPTPTPVLPPHYMVEAVLHGRCGACEQELYWVIVEIVEVPWATSADDAVSYIGSASWGVSDQRFVSLGSTTPWNLIHASITAEALSGDRYWIGPLLLADSDGVPESSRRFQSFVDGYWDHIRTSYRR